MNEQLEAPPVGVNLSSKQVGQAAMVTLTFLSLETTLIPGNLRRQLDVLEVVLTGLVSGKLVVASPDQLAVESTPDQEPKKDPDDGGTDQTPLEKRREPTRPELPKADAGVPARISALGGDEGSEGTE